LAGSTPERAGAAKGSLVSLSKPIWFYGLEALAGEILPPKEGSRRRVAFAQLSLLNIYPDFVAARKLPEDEFGRLSRALPLWLAETFYYCPHYAPIAALALIKAGDGPNLPMIFGYEWTVENLRDMVKSVEGGLDYIFTGSLSHKGGETELLLRVWEVKKFRERKQFTAKWTDSTMDAALAELHEKVRLFMEWAPYSAGQGLPYAPPKSARSRLDLLAASVGLFLAEKKLLPAELLPPFAERAPVLAAAAAESATSSLAWLTILFRARALGLATGDDATPLAADPIVAQAKEWLGR
jgi:hypothetical protein